jgi:hypothetical protein
LKLPSRPPQRACEKDEGKRLQNDPQVMMSFDSADEQSYRWSDVRIWGDWDGGFRGSRGVAHTKAKAPQSILQAGKRRVAVAA